MGRYRETYDRWKRDPEGFWAEAAREIDWSRSWDTVLSEESGLSRWFAGAECNTCWNALDRHVATRGDQAALIYDSAMTGKVKSFTYRELTEKVATFAGALQRHGVGKGDCVIIYMPMVPQAVVAMLACARLGAIHSVVFGGFAAKELATRIDDARPKLIVSAS
ncbi:MAG: AMP-binding protein, partial [Parvibaculum sedimenti]